MDAHALAAMSCQGYSDKMIDAEAEVIDFCAELGQVMAVTGSGVLHGFLAWFRVGREDVSLVSAGDFAAVRALPLETLTAGPVLVIADAAGVGTAARLLRYLRRAPGVETIVAMRHGRMRTHRVVRCRG